jgi:hypothetical protein
MELDTKQQILILFYAEYQKDIPQMEKVRERAKELGIDTKIFNIAVDKLQNEGFICGAQIGFGGNSPYPVFVIVDGVKMTRSGIDYVEQKLGIDHLLTGKEKLKYAAGKIAEWGFEQFKDLISKTLAEMANKAIIG